MYFPVFVEGANLSMGDMHFSQVRDCARSPPTRCCLPDTVSIAVSSTLWRLASYLGLFDQALMTDAA